MKIVRIACRGTEEWGVIQGARVCLLAEPPYRRIRFSGRTVPLSRARLGVPTVPTKIILVGLNYRDHARELSMRVPREPVIFLKPLTALIAHRQAIVCPAAAGRVDFEAELAVVMRRRARAVPAAQAARYILGYTCLNDVTARTLQKKDGQWTRAKSFDTFCPVGPWVETDCDPRQCRVESFVNGRRRQSSSPREFIFSIGRIVAFVSSVMTLLPGDIISTGTPPGVGRLRPGDTVDVAINGVGRLSNPVVRG